MDKRQKSKALPRTDIVVLGAANEAEAVETGKAVDAYMESVMKEMGMNDCERRVFTAMYSFRRTLGIVQEESGLPEPLRDTLMQMFIAVAREIPKELCDREKITKNILKVTPEIEKIIERVHKKHCPDCGAGKKHGAPEANSDAAAALKKHWD